MAASLHCLQNGTGSKDNDGSNGSMVREVMVMYGKRSVTLAPPSFKVTSLTTENHSQGVWKNGHTAPDF